VELVVFCGVQGAGKTSFYRYRFFETHVRVNLDMLRTRARERILVEACIAARQRFVVDNTNPTVEARRRYVEPAKSAGFEVVGFAFPSTPREALAINAGRPLQQQLSTKAVLETLERIERPTLEEGFDALYTVRMDGRGGFAVDPDDGRP
jgi:predicted kinase